MTALALRDDQDQWDAKQIAVLQQSGIDDDVTKAELAAFLHTCQRTGLDPFARQIYLVGRYDKRAGRKTYAPQTSIDGYRIIAQRSGEYAGQDGPFWCGADGEWVDVWLAEDAPRAAKVGVIRKGFSKPLYSVAKWESYVQTGKEGKPSGLWAKMPDLMLAKCAEALALRKAFPNDLAGVYTAEEMAQAENPTQERPVERAEAAATPEDDPFYVRPTPETDTDEAWLTDITGRVGAIKDKKTARTLWKEVTEKAKDGTCSTVDADNLKSLIKTHIEALDKANAEIVDAVVVENAETDRAWADDFEIRVDKAVTVGGVRGLRAELESVVSAGRVASNEVDNYRRLLNMRETELNHDGAEDAA